MSADCSSLLLAAPRWPLLTRLRRRLPRLHHPQGFYLLCLAVLCERWAALILSSSVVLMLGERYGYARGDALRLAGLFNAASYLATLPGGLAVDHVLGSRRSLGVGTVSYTHLDVYKRQGCTYSRYADDMAFSSAMALPTRFEVASALAAEGFRLSESKFRKTVRGQAHYVTGLSISESVPHAPRALKRRLRQELYYSTKFGIAEHLERVRAPDLQTGVNLSLIHI